MAKRSDPTNPRRQTILQAALEVFTTKTLTTATMDDIKAQSGASTGSIYHHFSSKEQLIATLYSEGYQDLHGHVRAAFGNAPGAAEGIRRIVDSYLGWFAAHPLLGMFLLQAAGSEFVAAPAASMGQAAIELEALVLAWLAPHIAAGTVAALPRSIYIPLIIGPCREVIRRWQAGFADLAQVRGPLAEAIWRSLAAGE